MTDLSPEFSEEFNRAMARIMGRAPRIRYFQKGNGPMFFWAVEKYDDDANTRFRGRYVSGVYQPRGRGSRSNKATSWEVDDSTLSGSSLRREAKARALRLYNEWRATQ